MVTSARRDRRTFSRGVSFARIAVFRSVRSFSKSGGAGGSLDAGVAYRRHCEKRAFLLGSWRRAGVLRILRRCCDIFAEV